MGKSIPKKRLSVIVSLFMALAVCTWLFSPQPANAGNQNQGQPADEVSPLSGGFFKKMLEQFWSKEYDGMSMDNFSLKLFNMFRPRYEWEVLAKAQPDECFQGLRNPLNQVSFYDNYPFGLSAEQQAACYGEPTNGLDTPAGHAQPKVNQAYVWGLTKYGDDLWFGTIPNTHCLVISGYLDIAQSSMNDSWVCEGVVNGTNLDFRPPRAFYYDTKAKELVEMTPAILAKGPIDRGLITTTIGLRSAGSHRGVVFLGGIGLNGVNIFAFNAKNHSYIGAISFDGRDGRPLYTNIRQWRVIKDELYVGLGKEGGGEILRWAGKSSDNLQKVFKFETVGGLLGDPAYITYHEGRIFASTWPAFGTDAQSPPMAIVMSPSLGKDRKLRACDAGGWKTVWDISDYDPEASVVFSTGGGAIMSYKGYLYWGTMHVPGLSLVAWQTLYGKTASEEDMDAALLGTYRPISIFRGKNFGSKRQSVQLLYGNSKLPMYVPSQGWQAVPNKMGQRPRFGLAGFNNFFNNYTWWMEVFDNRLFVGTMDFLYLAGAELGDEITLPPILENIVEKSYGADLWTFSSSWLPGSPVSISGVGNYSNYGVRTMVTTKNALYLGTANPMNLMTDPNDGLPEGGWELIELTRDRPLFGHRK